MRSVGTLYKEHYLIWGPCDHGHDGGGIVIKKRSQVSDKYEDVSNDLIWTTVIDCDLLSQNL